MPHDLLLLSSAILVLRCSPASGKQYVSLLFEAEKTGKELVTLHINYNYIITN